MWPVVQENCGHRCGPVVLLRCPQTARLVACCVGCGLSWLAPRDLISGTFRLIGHVCRDDGAIPTPAEIAASNWAGHVLRFLPASEFLSLADVNKVLADERREFLPRARDLES